MPLEIIPQRDISTIAARLKDGAHFTNGIYGIDIKKLLPTTVAFFTHLLDSTRDGRNIVIAMNSDKSLETLKLSGQYAAESERAQTLGLQLAHCFPNNNVIIVFFDEETPHQLYSGLKKEGVLEKSTLHKWGYGTKPDEPAIIGAELFEGRVYASPFPFDEKPLCYDQTERKQNENIEVIDLRPTVQSYDDLISVASPAANSPNTVFRFFQRHSTPIAIAATAVSAVAVTAMMSGGQ